ncbi:MAG: TonB-dependent receptor [Marinilabilia sp.]
MMLLRNSWIISLILFILQPSHSQTIRGTVTDASSGKPLPGANISITPGNKGSVASEEGFFEIPDADTGEQTIKCTFIGYRPMKKSINPAEGDTLIVNFTLMSEQLRIGEVVVQGGITGPVRRAGDALFTGSAITSEGISLMGTSANNSVYNALDIMPGITVEGHDSYGLSDKAVRIRGIRSTFSGMTIEGFPNYGIMPIGARDDIYDMENMNDVSVYKGAAPADLGTATGSKGGVIELKYRRPDDSASADIRQSAGSFGYTRSFARVDAGKITAGTRAFVSYSHTRANKWKGPGALGPRHNAALGFTQSINGNTEIELFANYNTIDRHHFRELNYEEASDISNYFEKDYSPTLNNDPSRDINYYDYNQGTYTNKDIMTIFRHTFSPSFQVQGKAYYSNEDADYDETVKRGPNNMVLNRIRDIDRAGIIPEVLGKKAGLDYTLGYWYESSDNNAYVYNSRIVPEGLEPEGYGFYTVNEENSIIHSPYLKLAYQNNGLKIQGGLKYFFYQQPGAERYTSDAPDQLSPIPDPALETEAMEHKAFLPSLGAGYDFTPQFRGYINYGRNYMRPYMYSPIISLYVNNQQTFEANGISLQDIFDDWTMETSDNFDLGLSYTSEHTVFSPSVFYAKHHDVLASAYDPVAGLDYYQNAGQLTAYGADIELYMNPVNSLTLILNPSWNHMSYDKDLIREDETIHIEGNQSPATPEFSVKAGTILRWGGFEASLLAKHTGERYGDATNEEIIDEYTTADVKISYNKDPFNIFKSFRASMEIKNLADTKYVGAINASDDGRQGSATYFAGTPRSFSGTVAVEF